MDAMQTYFNKRRYTLLKSENSTTSNTPVPDWLGKRPLPPIPQKERKAEAEYYWPPDC